MTRLTCTLLSLVTMACSSPTTPVAGDAPAATRTLVGTLVHDRAADGVKSVAAYLGAAFTLALADGDVVVLARSEVVDETRLRALAGARVTVTCTLERAAPPDPHESYPTGPDGEPLARPDRCRVTAIAAPP